MAEEHQSEAAQEEPTSSSRRQSLDSTTPFDFRDPAFSSDEFRMWEMKIRRCPRARPHDWTMCPFAHPGEKAKRRDPRKFKYSGTACAEYRKSGQCARGDSCCFSHGVFECWLHPNRYRTQLCTDGTNCRRRVCFFAHRECELRQLEGAAAAAAAFGAGTQHQADLAVEAAAALQGQTQLAHALHSFLEQQRVHQEQAVTAAAQLLDPLAKLRLMKSLQQMHPTAAAALAALEGRDPSNLDPTLLTTFPGLSNGVSRQEPPPAVLTRQSMDGLAGPHRPAAIHNAMLHSLSRKSVDIGSLSRPSGPLPPSASIAAGFMGTFDFVENRPANGTAPEYHGFPEAAERISPSLPMAPILLGSLPTASYMEFAAGRGHGSPPDVNDALLGDLTHLSSAGDVHSSSSASAGVSSVSVSTESSDRSRGLQSIDERGPLEGENGSMSSSVMVHSSSAGSSLDTPSEGGGNGGGGLSKGSLTHVPSFDNILAELPRSASQVNMAGLAGLA